MDPRTRARSRPHLAAPSARRGAPFEAVLDVGRPAAGSDAPGHARRPRRPARPHPGRDRRHRRPLPAHERAAVDRRARRLRRRLPAPRGPVRPLHAAIRSRCRRPAGSIRTASTTRPGRPAGRDAEGRPAGQEGRGAPADPGPPASATTRSGSWTAGSRSRCRGAGGRSPARSRDAPGRRSGSAVVAGLGRGVKARTISHDLVGVVGHLEQVEVGSLDRAVGQRACRGSSRAGPPSSARPTRTTGKCADLAGLDQGQRLEQLVQRAEAAGQDHERVGVLHEHHLAGEEVAELDAEVDVRVEALLVGQLDVAADRQSRRPRGSRGWRPP